MAFSFDFQFEMCVFVLFSSGCLRIFLVITVLFKPMHQKRKQAHAKKIFKRTEDL